MFYVDLRNRGNWLNSEVREVNIFIRNKKEKLNYLL